MAPKPRYKNACETCRQYARLTNEGDIVLCRKCTDKLADLLSNGYLVAAELAITELYEVSAQTEVADENQAPDMEVIPRLIIHPRSKHPAEVEDHPLQEDQMSMAMSYFLGKNNTSLAIIGFDTCFAPELWHGLLEPFLTGNTERQEYIRRHLKPRPCHACGKMFPSHRHAITLGARDAALFFCSNSCQGQFGCCIECGGIHRREFFHRPTSRPESVSRLPEPGLCPACYERSKRRCSLCNTRISRYEMQDVRGPGPEREGISICWSCFDQHNIPCSHCERQHMSWDLHVLEGETDRRLCNNCLERWESRIYQYNWRPKRFIHHGEPPLYGIEIETDHFPNPAGLYSRRIHHLSENERFFYMKRDGSLSNGFELVFHPRSMESWEGSWPRVEEILASIEEFGGKAFRTDTCGFHVHRSKWDLKDIDYMKICLLLKRWKARLLKVAQRNNNRYAGWNIFDDRLPQPSRNNASSVKRQGFRFIKNGDHTLERYQCVNFGSNPDSIEFRIFKGSIFGPTLKAYIAFTHFFVEFATSRLISELSMDSVLKHKLSIPSLWDEFCNYIYKAHKKRSFATDCLDLLSKQGVGHQGWQAIITDWKEV